MLSAADDLVPTPAPWSASRAVQTRTAKFENWIGGQRPGDWCEATNAAADATCKDAYKLEADFSASAFKINGDCP